MSNAKISEKGRAFLNRRFSSLSVSKAIANDRGDRLYSKEGLSVQIDGRKIVIRGVSSFSSKEITPTVLK